MSSRSLRSSSDSMSWASFQSASTVTRPCCMTTERYCRVVSKDARALSLPIRCSLLCHVDEYGDQTDRHEFLKLDAEASLFDGAHFPSERSHFRAVLGAAGNRGPSCGIDDHCVDAQGQLAVSGLAKAAGRGKLRAGRDLDAFVLFRGNAAGRPGRETDAAVLRAFDEEEIVENALAGLEPVHRGRPENRGPLEGHRARGRVESQIVGLEQRRWGCELQQRAIEAAT